ncbi:hypothetical protein [Jiella marina]|uniref:hypothetical protein n=1 Tax=Jiella sp. LLJ827 TaxID=2917712 RepID=UPI0021017FA2|nr:hypothetical protein [Jiella sp. LLJ827]MCQ0990544.1 hypothetical protein [Jiella sp. LLJ827]
MSRPSVFGQVDLPKPTETTPVATATEPATKPDKDIVKTSTYLPREVHDVLREIAFHERNKVHDLLIEGVEHILKTRRHPSITELKQRHDGKAA